MAVLRMKALVPAISRQNKPWRLRFYYFDKSNGLFFSLKLSDGPESDRVQTGDHLDICDPGKACPSSVKSRQ
jgi:hypothetical protein